MQGRAGALSSYMTLGRWHAECNGMENNANVEATSAGGCQALTRGLCSSCAGCGGASRVEHQSRVFIGSGLFETPDAIALAIRQCRQAKASKLGGQGS